MANIVELPYGVLGTAPKPCSQSCKEKRAARAKFVVFRHLLIGLVSFDVLIAVTVAVAFVVPPEFIDVRKRLGIQTRFL